MRLPTSQGTGVSMQPLMSPLWLFLSVRSLGTPAMNDLSQGGP